MRRVCVNECTKAAILTFWKIVRGYVIYVHVTMYVWLRIVLSSKMVVDLRLQIRSNLLL